MFNHNRLRNIFFGIDSLSLITYQLFPYNFVPHQLLCYLGLPPLHPPRRVVGREGDVCFSWDKILLIIMQIEWKEQGEAGGEAGPGMLRGAACPCPRQDRCGSGSPGSPSPPQGLHPRGGTPRFSTLLRFILELLRCVCASQAWCWLRAEISASQSPGELSPPSLPRLLRQPPIWKGHFQSIRAPPART